MKSKERSLARTIFLYFLPIALGFLLQQAYSIADGLVLGRLSGSRALAAISGSNSTIISLVITFFAGISSGPMVLIAQAYGKGNKKEVKKVIANALFISLAIGFAFFIIIEVSALNIHKALKTPEDIIDESVRYIKWYFMGMVPTLLFNMGSNMLRSFGEVKKPLIFLAICTLSNVVFDILFVLIMEDDIKAVAIASALSQLISALLILLSLLRLDKDMSLSLSFDLEVIKNSLKIGIPTALQNSMYFITGLIISVAINRLGTDSVAAWAIFYKYDGLFWALSSSFNLSLTALSGQFYGASDEKALRDSALKGVLCYLAVALPFSIILFVFRYPLSLLFTPDSAVVEEAARIIGYIALTYPTFTITEIFAAIMRGTGNTFKPTLITFMSIFVLRLVMLFTIVLRFPSDFAIACCYFIPWIVSSLLFAFYYFFGSWLNKEAFNE